MSTPDDKAAVGEQALIDEMIVATLRGEATAIDRRRLEKRLVESAANQQHFEDFERIWLAGPTEPSAEEDLPLAPQVDALIERGDALVRTEARRQFSPSPVTRRVLSGALAAGIAAVAVGAWLGTSMLPQPGPETVYVAGNSESSTVLLEDGSGVRLAPRARIAYADGEARRGGRLIGRAFFAVAPSDPRVFTVGTAVGDVTVVGTRFEVDAMPNALTVIVVEGRVTVQAAGTLVSVYAGQLARVHEDGRVTVQDLEDIYSALDWPEGTLMFRDSPLSEVISALEHHFEVRVDVAPALLRQRTLTATFGRESLQEVVDSVCLILGVDCSLQGERLTIGAQVTP